MDESAANIEYVVQAQFSVCVCTAFVVEKSNYELNKSNFSNFFISVSKYHNTPKTTKNIFYDKTSSFLNILILCEGSGNSIFRNTDHVIINT